MEQQKYYTPWKQWHAITTNHSMKIILLLSIDMFFQQEVFPASDVTTKKRPDTAVTQFKNSLNHLMEILMNKEPSYIRCIKPNDKQKSGMYTEYVTSNKKQRHLYEIWGLHAVEIQPVITSNMASCSLVSCSQYTPGFVTICKVKVEWRWRQ